MTDKLRKIITRDTIITISIIGPIAAFLDIVIEPTLTNTDKIISYILISLFILVGIVRLIRGSVLDRKPIYSIIIYQLILIPATAYFADVRSFYVFFWIIPFYLASFYYGKKVIYSSFAVLAITQIAKIIIFTKFGYITRFEDYMYMVSEYFIVIALSVLVIDTTIVSEEDRKILLESLDKTELEQKRLSAVINSINNGVVSLDSNFMIVSFNAAALSILDRHEDILGKNFKDICVVESLDGKTIDISKLVGNGQHDNECYIRYSDGQKATLEIYAVPIRTTALQENEGSVFLLRDITKQKSLEEERNAFVSLMSHELRTPLTIAEANVSNAKLIIKRGDISKSEEALEKVADEVAHLTRITNDFSLVLDSSSNITSLPKNQIHLEDICHKLVEMYKPYADKKSVIFSAHVAPNTINEIYTSPEYFEHIVQSFTDNAIKFTEKGSVAIVFSEKDKVLLVSVEDTGLGIPKSDQAKVFSPFYQSDDYETRSYGGLGVGLYTAKKLAEIIGGRVAFTSEKDHGSIFTLSVPLNLLVIPEQIQNDKKFV